MASDKKTKYEKIADRRRRRMAKKTKNPREKSMLESGYAKPEGYTLKSKQSGPKKRYGKSKFRKTKSKSKHYMIEEMPKQKAEGKRVESSRREQMGMEHGVYAGTKKVHGKKYGDVSKKEQEQLSREAGKPGQSPEESSKVDVKIKDKGPEVETKMVPIKRDPEQSKKLRELDVYMRETGQLPGKEDKLKKTKKWAKAMKPSRKRDQVTGKEKTVIKSYGSKKERDPGKWEIKSQTDKSYTAERTKTKGDKKITKRKTVSYGKKRRRGY